MISPQNPSGGPGTEGFAIPALILFGRQPDRHGLKKDKATLATLSRLDLADATLDLKENRVLISRLALDKPKAELLRDRNGRWMYQAWLKPPSQGAAAVKGATQAKPGVPADWSVTFTELSISNGAASYRDELPAKPVLAEFSAVKLHLKNFSPVTAADASRPAKPTELDLSAQIRAGSTEPGQLTYQGNLSLAPLETKGSLQLKRLPLHAFEPYFGDQLNIELLRADVSFKGGIAYATAATSDNPSALRLRVTGDSALEEVRAMTLPTKPQGATQVPGAEELVTWKVLSLRGLDLALAPRTPLALTVAETVLTDFYARVVVDPQGRINLQNLVKSEATAASPGGAASATMPPSGAASAAVPPSALAASDAARSSLAAVDQPSISFGPISLVNGRVQFTDLFIRPNYSAALSELTGRLSAFSSHSAQSADLELRGRAEGTALLEISGKLNPLAQPLALDIKAKVRDLELAPMSPYSVKYAGHGIQRGKLSVDLAYLLLPDGQLTASNKLVLNQLTFGDKVDGAPASLPVRLAVALLADRNGIIDIDLPISGSLSDPQFRLLPIIFKVIGNLIVKAITSPFSLLASAFGGGGDELGMVGFEPGSSSLGSKAVEGLDKVVKALNDRPGLKMTVQGGASLELEREALKRALLSSLVLAEKRRNMVLAGASLPTASEPALTVAAGEYPGLLAAAFRRSELPKPLDDAGKPKELPLADMENLLVAYIKVDEELVRELAQQRGLAVRDYLASRQLPLDRLFLGPAKLAGNEANWMPRAELTLATP